MDGRKQTKKCHIDRYLDLAGEPRKLCNRKASMILIVVDTLRKFNNDQEKKLGELEIRERIRTI